VQEIATIVMSPATTIPGAAATVVEPAGDASDVKNDMPNNAPPVWRRGFWSLVITQFQGAFNENGLKNLVIFLILGMAMQKGDRDQLVLIVGTLFSVPFILFSMTGGFLADRYSKRSVTIWTKLFEMAVMGLAIAGLGWQNLHLEMAAVFLASTQAALFGPSKWIAAGVAAGAVALMGKRCARTWDISGGDCRRRFGRVPGRLFSGASRVVGADLSGPVCCGIDFQFWNHEGSRR
jgi:MFS family permease